MVPTVLCSPFLLFPCRSYHNGLLFVLDHIKTGLFFRVFQLSEIHFSWFSSRLDSSQYWGAAQVPFTQKPTLTTYLPLHPRSVAFPLLHRPLSKKILAPFSICHCLIFPTGTEAPWEQDLCLFTTISLCLAQNRNIISIELEKKFFRQNKSWDKRAFKWWAPDQIIDSWSKNYYQGTRWCQLSEMLEGGQER